MTPVGCLVTLDEKIASSKEGIIVNAPSDEMKEWQHRNCTETNGLFWTPLGVTWFTVSPTQHTHIAHLEGKDNFVIGEQVSSVYKNR